MNPNRIIVFFFVITTLLLAVLYFYWYWISPISDAFETGRFLFIIYFLTTLFWVFFREKASLLASLFVYLFFLINIMYYSNFVSSILDEVEYDGVQYYLTYSQEPIDGWHDYHITAREGLFHYNSHGLGLGFTTGNLKLKYDTTIDKMTVIETQIYHREIILSIEEDNPLFYEAFVELNNNIYYLFSSCKELGVDCQNRIYSLYKCKFNNTYCEQLPFMYDGKYGGYSSKLIGYETTSEIEIYFEIYFYEEQEFREVLIYSYGAEPRCYIEDCYILEITK